MLEGKIPYRDFFFVQGPVYPYLYGGARALLLPFLGSSILTARITSGAFGLAASILAIFTARRAGGSPLLTALLLLPNSFLAFAFTVEKLYAPTAFFISLAAFLACRRSRLSLVMAAVSLAVATGLRLTVLPAIAAIALLAFARAERKLSVLLPLVAFAAALLALFLPFVVIDRTALFYGLLGIHESAGTGTAYHFGIANKAMVVLSLARDNQLIALLTLVAVPALCWELLKGSWNTVGIWDDAEVWFLWVLAACVGAANFTANWVHAEYHTIQMPVLGAALGVSIPRLSRLVKDPRARRGAAAAFVVGALCQPLAFGRREIWTRDARIVSPYAPEIVAFLRDHAAPGEPVLVANPAFAIEADRPLLRGSEGLPFTYTPGWSTEQCRRRVSLDDELLVEAFRAKTPAVVALTKDQFHVASPGFVVRPDGADAAIWSALDESYRLVARLPNPDATSNDVLAYVRR